MKRITIETPAPASNELMTEIQDYVFANCGVAIKLEIDRTANDGQTMFADIEDGKLDEVVDVIISEKFGDCNVGITDATD